MIPRHRMVIATLTWVAIVAVGSTLVWTVVGHAGRGLGGRTDTVAATTAPSESGIGEADASSLDASPSQEPTSAAEPTSSGDTPPDGGPGPSTGPGGGETDGGGDPGFTEGSNPTTTPSATVAPGGGDDDPPASPDPPPQSQQKTWQGPAGRVVAACTGDRISLVAAQPNNGWHVEVENDGPEELSVHFELREEEDDDRVAARALAEETEISARCVGGSPSFAT